MYLSLLLVDDPKLVTLVDSVLIKFLDQLLSFGIGNSDHLIHI